MKNNSRFGFQHCFMVVWSRIGLVGLTHCFLMDNGEATEFGGVSRQLAIQFVNSVISPVVIFYSLYTPHSFKNDSPKLMWFLDVRRYCSYLHYLDSWSYDSVIYRLSQELLQGNKGALTRSLRIASGEESCNSSDWPWCALAYRSSLTYQSWSFSDDLLIGISIPWWLSGLYPITSVYNLPGPIDAQLINFGLAPQGWFTCDDCYPHISGILLGWD